MIHRDAYEVIIAGAVDRWYAENQSLRLPHDSQLIVMGALIDKVDALGRNGARRMRDRVKAASLPVGGGIGLGSFVVMLERLIS